MILVLFCGAGGSTKGVHDALPGAGIVGIDNDADACATHKAAGFSTVCADIVGLDPMDFANQVSGLWASPPCPDFSMAGKRQGVDGPTGKLIFVAMEWARVINPPWIVFEQVPPVLPYWREFALELDGVGYKTWSGILNAANYGVPQTRERAFLLASRTRAHLLPPEPTHAEHPHPRLDGTEELPWVSMAEALGWDDDRSIRMDNRPHASVRSSSQPSPTITAAHDNNVCLWLLNTHRDQREDGSTQTRAPAPPAPSVTGQADRWWWERPSTTVMGDSRIFPPDGHHPEMGMGTSTSRAIKVTLEELAILQGFDPTYPFKGNKSARARAIGNAVPPRVAEVCVRAVA